jgi:hypothetical protein
MEVKYRICVFGGMGEEKKLMKRRKRVPARAADTYLPYTSYLLPGFQCFICFLLVFTRG